MTHEKEVEQLLTRNAMALERIAETLEKLARCVTHSAASSGYLFQVTDVGHSEKEK